MLSVFLAFGIEWKFFFIYLDNASKNIAAIEILKNYTSINLEGKLFHIRCHCHIINLYVQNELRIINESILKLRNTTSFLKYDGLRKQNFKYICKNFKFLPKIIPQDVRTQWIPSYGSMEELCKILQDITRGNSIQECIVIICRNQIVFCQMDHIEWN